MTTNKESTRYYSDLQEKAICNLLGGIQVSNSGAGKFKKGDVIVKDASLLIEAKTTMSSKESISIRKDWIVKNREEAFSNRLDNSCVAINFGPGEPNYFVIDESMMHFLVEKIIEELS